ncbi:hypothetical protein CRENPOLYSF2_1940002 [Crenothrix polyspora]|uniref:HEAT repeat domain-containing protein n=1 Tax=Crenothrix polyspora TaxID=360316 RepID=A0A1R4H3U9_9GAMM|nr:HEAT repeat domain-containing protein [Crenothrix polyspora]SJM90933.1 hypothetical protein CRENPOLYSF2_1940002 [Crenothrix polyspora]
MVRIFTIYEQQVFDHKLKFDQRLEAFSILAMIGTDLGILYRRLKENKNIDECAEHWDFLFLMLCTQYPFADAIPLLEHSLSAVEKKENPLLIPQLMKLGGLPITEATSLLLHALPHIDPRIRLCAAQMLGQRRSRLALAGLSEQLAREEDESIALTLAVSIIASGPRSVADVSSIRFDSPTIKLWQCILAMRSRDSSISDLLVTLACGPDQNWQIRRAAIFAAGRLPYEVALERIAPLVLLERSPFVIDRNPHLLCHNNLADLLLNESRGMLNIYIRGKTQFVSFFEEIFDTGWKEFLSFDQDVPTGAEAAGWLFDRLTYYSWPVNKQAPDLVINELHIP